MDDQLTIISSLRGAFDDAMKYDVNFVISIGDPGDHIPAFHLLDVEVLRLEFNDIIGGPGIRFGAIHGKQVVDFITPRLHEGRFLVHCHAGISRSAAVAAAIEILKHPEMPVEDCVQPLFDAFEPIEPNSMVLEIVLDTAGVDMDRTGDALEVSHDRYRGWVKRNEHKPIF